MFTTKSFNMIRVCTMMRKRISPFQYRLTSTNTKQGEKYGTFLEEWKKYRMPATLGFMCLAALQVKHIYFREINLDFPIITPGDKAYGDVFLRLVEYGIPYSFISHWWGKLASTHLYTTWLKSLVYGWWTRTYNCIVEDMAYPLTEYESLQAFFLRPLKTGVRKVDISSPGTIISPVDAQILHVSSVEINTQQDNARIEIEQIKGVTYVLEDFIGRFASAFSLERMKKEKRFLRTVVLYLAPGDYHHFHSPADWEILQRRHFAGNLLPVRPWFVENLPGMYCTNERVVLNGKWKGGFFSFGAVGALNVGSIDIKFDKDLITNTDSSWPFQRKSRKCAERAYAIPVDMTRGQPIGSFNLGSTIVLVFETSSEWKFNVESGDVVKVGQSLGADESIRPVARQLKTISCPPWPGDGNAEAYIKQTESLRKKE